jgi:hypothetical protein
MVGLALLQARHHCSNFRSGLPEKSPHESFRPPQFRFDAVQLVIKKSAARAFMQRPI